MRKLLVLILVAVLHTELAVAKQPFVGSWAGGPKTCADPFVFTDTTYSYQKGKVIMMSSIERDGNWFLLSFADGYRVTLMNVKSTSMTWHSPISGSTFDLRRCK
jgi:hypothetical protein